MRQPQPPLTHHVCRDPYHTNHYARLSLGSCSHLLPRTASYQKRASPLPAIEYEALVFVGRSIVYCILRRPADKEVSDASPCGQGSMPQERPRDVAGRVVAAESVAATSCKQQRRKAVDMTCGTARRLALAAQLIVHRRLAVSGDLNRSACVFCLAFAFAASSFPQCLFSQFHIRFPSILELGLLGPPKGAEY